MTKCKVISRNPINMVVDFNGTLVQMPTDNGIDKYVFVSCNNGNYAVVAEITNKKNEKITKKTQKEISTQTEHTVMDEKSSEKVDETGDIIV